MTDIVELLRNVKDWSDAIPAMEQAADEIERLREENKQLHFAVGETLTCEAQERGEYGDKPDLVAHLRAWAEDKHDPGLKAIRLTEAADEIERLRARLEIDHHYALDRGTGKL